MIEVTKDSIVDNIINGWKQTHSAHLSKNSVFSYREYSILSNALEMYCDMHDVSGLEVDPQEGGHVEEWEYTILREKLRELWSDER